MAYTYGCPLALSAHFITRHPLPLRLGSSLAARDSLMSFCISHPDPCRTPTVSGQRAPSPSPPSAPLHGPSARNSKGQCGGATRRAGRDKGTSSRRGQMDAGLARGGREPTDGVPCRTASRPPKRARNRGVVSQYIADSRERYARRRRAPSAFSVQLQEAPSCQSYITPYM